MAGNQEQPQASNFKKKAELTIQFYLNESDNADYRSMIKKLTEATWDYANKIAHSSSATYYEASTCVSLCISLVCVYENVRNDIFIWRKYSCKGWLYFLLLWVKILGNGYSTETVKVVLQYGADEIGYNNIAIFVAKSNYRSQNVLSRLGVWLNHQRIGKFHVIHPKNLIVKNDVIYLPSYMTFYL